MTTISDAYKMKRSRSAGAPNDKMSGRTFCLNKNDLEFKISILLIILRREPSSLPQNDLLRLTDQKNTRVGVAISMSFCNQGFIDNKGCYFL